MTKQRTPHLPDTPEEREAWLAEARRWEAKAFEEEMRGLRRRTREPVDPLARLREG